MLPSAAWDPATSFPWCPRPLEPGTRPPEPLERAATIIPFPYGPTASAALTLGLVIPRRGQKSLVAVGGRNVFSFTEFLILCSQ